MGWAPTFALAWRPPLHPASVSPSGSSQGAGLALSDQERLAWLRTVALFRGCSETSLARLAERTGEVRSGRGLSIVQQGQVGNGLFILVAGTARVVTGDHELAHLGPGDVIGELSVID